MYDDWAQDESMCGSVIPVGSLITSSGQHDWIGGSWPRNKASIRSRGLSNVSAGLCLPPAVPPFLLDYGGEWRRWPKADLTR
jgi:hypothetical protein